MENIKWWIFFIITVMTYLLFFFLFLLSIQTVIDLVWEDLDFRFDFGIHRLVGYLGLALETVQQRIMGFRIQVCWRNRHLIGLAFDFLSFLVIVPIVLETAYIGRKKKRGGGPPTLNSFLLIPWTPYWWVQVTTYKKWERHI